MVPGAEQEGGDGGRERQNGEGGKSKRQTDRNTDRGGKFSFASENEGSCGFSIMIPRTLITTFALLSNGFMPAATLWVRVHFRSQERSCIRCEKEEKRVLQRMWTPSADRCHFLQRKGFKSARWLQTDGVKPAKYFILTRVEKPPLDHETLKCGNVSKIWSKCENLYGLSIYLN